jgi:uncharacterized RDD family membrane protein YckC
LSPGKPVLTSTLPGEFMNYASRLQRLLGQFIDGLVGAAPIVLFAILFQFSDLLGGIAVIVAVLWVIFYYFFADALHDGQSFAKQWLGMRVVSEETGAPCTFGQSFLRNLLLGLLGPIDWIFIFGEAHQRLGDKVAGTVVIKA